MKVRVRVTREVLADPQQIIEAVVHQHDIVTGVEVIEDDHGGLFIELTKETHE